MAANPYPSTATPGRIVAHRGASLAAPENTLEAFAAAQDEGTDWVEFDVSLLGDGTPVVFHDATLDRCTTATGPLARIGAGDLAGIDAGSRHGAAFAGARIPTLEATLDLLEARGMSANLEIKPQGADPAAVTAAVARALSARPWADARIVVSSFSEAALAGLRDAAPGLPLAMLFDAPPPDWRARLAGLRAGGLHVNAAHADAALLTAAEGEGIALRLFTVNDPASLHDLRLPGLAGVITDTPRAFLADPGWAEWAAR